MRMRPRDDRRARTVLVLSLLAAASVISLDVAGDGTPVGPVRSAVGGVMGPAQSGAYALGSPVRAAAGWFESDADLERENADLREQLQDLRADTRTRGVVRSRADQRDGIERIVADAGVRTVDAEVVGLGSAQGFARTVTVDVGTADGVRADHTVLDGDGLVGRVVEVTEHHATVLLAVDATSEVGVRVVRTGELGFVAGDGDLTGDGTLSLDAVDGAAGLRTGDVLVTWGARGDSPYVPGIPIGEVVDVVESPRDQTTTGEAEPFVDFSSLDLVSVVIDGDVAPDDGSAESATDDGTRAAGGRR